MRQKGINEPVAIAAFPADDMPGYYSGSHETSTVSFRVDSMSIPEREIVKAIASGRIPGEVKSFTIRTSRTTHYRR